jgi:hypothetical protein
MAAESAGMTASAIRLTRRGIVAAFVGASVSPAALAGPTLVFPLRLGYARVGETGFVAIRSSEQEAWTQLQTRLGGLINTIEPIQPSDMLGAKAPELDGGASCALVARQLAANAGYSHVILYATQDGRKTYKHGASWVSRAFASLRSEYLKYDRATGEAHLLDVAGGPAIASVSADAAPRDPIDPSDNHRNPEREALTGLTTALERRLQSLSRAGFDAQRSIAD